MPAIAISALLDTVDIARDGENLSAYQCVFIYVKLCFCWHMHVFCVCLSLRMRLCGHIYRYCVYVCMCERKGGTREIHQQHVTQKSDTFLPVLTRNFNFYF